MKDPIVEEVRKIRHAHAARFNFDLHAICEDLRRKERNCGHPLVTLPPKRRLKATGN
jgi:hypothetical protein